MKTLLFPNRQRSSVLILACLLVLLAAIVLGLAALGLAAWLAAAIVAIATIAIGGIITNRGIARLRLMSMTPTQTIESVKEDVKWTTRQRA